LKTRDTIFEKTTTTKVAKYAIHV